MYFHLQIITSFLMLSLIHICVVKDDVKLPTLKLPKYLKTVAMHADDLDAASYRLNEIRKAIEEENMHEI